MTPLILTADEAVLAASDTLTEIRRPIEGLPANPVNVRHLGLGYLKCDAPPGSDTVSLRIQCPWGGDELLYVCEAWRTWDDNECQHDADADCSPHCRQVYVAYEATPGKGFRPVPDGAAITWFDEGGQPDAWLAAKLRRPWRSAATMPVPCSRFAYRGRTRVELVDGVWQWVLAVERVNRENGAPVPPVECQ